jgi:plastocyanin
MNRLTIQLATTLLAGMTVTGCKKASDAPQAAANGRANISASAEAASTTPLGIGSIQGKVVFAGKAPAPRPIDNQLCCPNAKPIFEESIIVNPNGTLKNTVVYLKDVPGNAKISADVPVIDQVNCQYVPHVIAIAAGQKVVFKSSDPTLHNVHVFHEKGEQKNLAMPTPSQYLAPVKFPEAEFVKVKCDVHPWMQCRIAVMDGPYFAVTNDKGEFEIKSVPAGTYTLNAWHEKFDPMTTEVVVAVDKTAATTFTVQAP